MSQAPSGAIHARTAFTLLELLTVIAIISLLAGLVLGVGRRAGESAKAARTRAELATLSAALASYQRAHGDYPQTADAARLLQALIGRQGPLGTAITGRATIETARLTVVLPGAVAVPVDASTNAAAVLADPWGQPYVYAYKAPAGGWSNPSFVLYSIGPDGKDTPALLAGGFPDPAAAGNTDNIYGNPD